MPQYTPPERHALALLRIVTALLLAAHGWHRALTGGAWGFAQWLGAQGFPLPAVLAWGITGFEIAGSALLLTGRAVRLVVPGFALILVMGIVLVHGREGWWVVGAGRNGVEYSVLLLASLAALWIAEGRRRG
jgi:putative oxidoreductase